jgi:membrane-associated PAP2 superfamily phosphatase
LSFDRDLDLWFEAVVESESAWDGPASPIDSVRRIARLLLGLSFVGLRVSDAA